MTALVTVHGGSLARAGRTILQDIDFQIARGEIVTLIGPNGAGKSTLVKVVLGLEQLDRGTVARVPGLRVGYQPQGYAIDRALPLTVRRLVTLNCTASRARVTEVLRMLHIADLAEADVHALSGGERQRAMLARAILREPDLLVLDEPSQNLDVSGTVEIYEIVAAMRQTTGCAVLVVSHDLNVVMAATDRVYCLNTHICCSGHPEDVSRSAAFRDIFGPTAKTMALYTHHHDHVHDTDGHVHAVHDHGHDHGHSHGAQ
jgi:zinc transport system ATP-binding protein